MSKLFEIGWFTRPISHNTPCNRELCNVLMKTLDTILPISLLQPMLHAMPSDGILKFRLTFKGVGSLSDGISCTEAAMRDIDSDGHPDIVVADGGRRLIVYRNLTGRTNMLLEGVYINGAPQGISFHETEDYTIYHAPIITVTKNRFTKHYFIGSKRIASKIGTGRFSNVYGIGGNNITAGQKDYAARMMQIEKQREEYYKSLGTPPGVPTMKGATADPDNTGYGYNTIIGELGDHSVLLYVKENAPKSSNQTPVTLLDAPSGNVVGHGSKRAVSFYSSSEYDKAFGTATLYYNSKGNIIGFFDHYDFDSKPWGERSVKNELITRAVETVSPSEAKDFKIRYGYSKR